MSDMRYGTLIKEYCYRLILNTKQWKTFEDLTNLQDEEMLLERIITILDSDDDGVVSDEFDCDESEWSQNDSDPAFHDCMEQSGIQTLCEHLDVKSSVELFIEEEVLNLLARETNRYYQQQGNHNETKKDEATDVVEMKKFLGLIITMGLVKKSEKDEYWFTNPVLCTVIFGNTMK
ncbi:piggyBac transposable element-derived protein 4-like [Bombus flavifrons]|uniref:piggyBac transposable element-derived protein 4-like n=1 Tax=Bombus flavifrons TaxID=103934 RepID=UPI003704CEEC